MAQHRVIEAAGMVGKDRKSLYRHMKQGRLSYSLATDGTRLIDTTELIRAYGSIKEIETGETQPVPQVETPSEIAELKKIIERLASKVEGLESKISKLLLLEHKPNNMDKPEPKPETKQQPGKHQFSSIMDKLKADQVKHGTYRD